MSSLREKIAAVEKPLSFVSISPTFLAAAPGLAVFLVLWITTYRVVAFHLIAENAFGWWQSLGRGILESDGWVALTTLHIQPPGFNALQLIDLHFTPDSHKVLGLMFGGMTALCLLLIVDCVRAVGVRTRWAAVAGLVFALLPATVAYSLWPFSTVPTMLAGALVLWGASRLAQRPVFGALGIGVGGLWGFLNRPTFTWFVVLVLVVSAGIWLMRVRPRPRRFASAMAILMFSGLTVVGVQLHYFVSFGLISTSSWTGENIVKALTQSGKLSIDAGVSSEFPETSCEANLVEALREGAWLVWRPADFANVTGCRDITPEASKGILAWDSSAKDGRDDGAWEGNFNWSQRLVNSRVWNRAAIAVIASEPLQVARMAFVGPTSGFALMMRPAHELEGDFTPLVQQNPAYWFLSPFASLLAPLALGLVAISWPFAIRSHRQSQSLLMTLSAGTFLIVSLTTLSLVEFGENQRFQQELSPILLIMIAVSLHAIRRRSSNLPGTLARHGEQASSEESRGSASLR